MQNRYNIQAITPCGTIQEADCDSVEEVEEHKQAFLEFGCTILGVIDRSRQSDCLLDNSR